VTRTPSPIITRGNTELPSPAGGEGTVTSIALALISHDVKQPISFPRRMSAPGACNFGLLTRIEGGRSAEKRSGARRNTRGAYHVRQRRA
jgi:hypothetical protein